jgi:hypothetical protein
MARFLAGVSRFGSLSWKLRSGILAIGIVQLSSLWTCCRSSVRRARKSYRGAGINSVRKATRPSMKSTGHLAVVRPRP